MTLVGVIVVLCLLPTLSVCTLETDVCIDMEVRTDKPILTHIPKPNTETCKLKGKSHK